ncbi:hypothetical protein AB0J38_25880 [Streptomyces sp. NPDC050095]|uniref:hypothetical protein n=1 Tax=unclassified Streptomyces TaxID=2593676 RepID=UPI00343B230D
MPKRDSVEWLRIYDRSPVADIGVSATYCMETSDDGGRTWKFPAASRGEFLKLDMAEALYAGCSVEVRGGVVTIHSPYPMGGLIRYTPTH